MDGAYYNFYHMVKAWTARDYCTPGVKAEIILDMLLSDFIEDLVRYHYFGEGKGCNVTLLAKEFPIGVNEENHLNAKVDYLVSIGSNKLALVELKTTNDSYTGRQNNRIIHAVEGGARELMDFYYRIVRLKGGNTLDRKKYGYAYKSFTENLAKAQLDEEKAKAIQELDYLYISLTDHRSLPKKKLILEGLCENEPFANSLESEGRRLLWEHVSGILKMCIEERERM